MPLSLANLCKNTPKPEEGSLFQIRICIPQNVPSAKAHLQESSSTEWQLVTVESRNSFGFPRAFQEEEDMARKLRSTADLRMLLRVSSCSVSLSGVYTRITQDNRQFKHQTLFATQTQTQRNLIVKANQMYMYRNCHTLISHWPKKLGYIGFEFTLLQLTFGA